MLNKASVDPSAPLMDRATAFVPEAWNTVKTAYSMYRMGIMEARLRYANQQWLAWDQDKRVFRRELPKDDWVPMPNINRFGPWIDGIASNFSAVPEIEAIPVPLDDPISMGIADVANKLCDHAIKDNALRSDYGGREDRSNLARQIYTLSGCVFSKVRLEQKEIGQKPVGEGTPTYTAQCLQCGNVYPDLPSPPQSCPSCGSTQLTIENGETPSDQTEAVTKPRVIVDIEDPMWYSPRPGATTMDNAGWIIVARRLSIDQVKERTGIEATADGEYPDGYNLSYQNELNYWYLGYSTPAEKMQDSCLFIEFYCEPGKKEAFPEGCHAYYFNGKVRLAEPWSKLGPVDHPLTKADYMALPGIFFPRSVAFDLCEIQAQLSRLDSFIELHLKTNAVEPIVIDANTQVNEITGRADKLVIWRSIGPGSKEPHRMQHGVIDPAAYERVQYLETKGDRIAAVSAVWRGDAPGQGVTANSALQTLRGQNELQFSNPTTSWSNFWKETIRKTLPFYQKYPLDELVAIIGQDKIAQINDFVNADLKKCLELIATAHGLPRTRDERRQEMMVLFDKGVLDKDDPHVRQKIFELFGDTGMMDNFNEDATRCRANIRNIKSGKPAQFRPGIDDAGIHASIATSAAKAMDFDQWPPQAQQMLLQYIQTVQQALQASMPPDPNIAKAQMDQQTKALQGNLEKQMADDRNRTALDIAVINATVKEQVENLTLQQDQIKHFIDTLMEAQQQQQAAEQAAQQPQPAAQS